MPYCNSLGEHVPALSVIVLSNRTTGDDCSLKWVARVTEVDARWWPLRPHFALAFFVPFAFFSEFRFLIS
jgi:hypothetical protein